MTGDDRVAQAQADADAKRARLIDTIQDLAQMLEPRRLMRELWEDAKVKGADLAEEAVDAVKARPVAAGGVAAAVALFLARAPISELAGKLIGSKEKKPKPARTKGKKTKQVPPQRDQVENAGEAKSEMETNDD